MSPVEARAVMTSAAERELLAEIRVLHQEARPWLENTLKVRAAPPGSYLPLSTLEVAFVSSKGGEAPEGVRGQRLCKAAGKALARELVALFGEELPRLYFPRGNAKIKGDAFGVESDEFPAVVPQFEPGEALAGRKVRREQRLGDGDLAVRPSAEGGLGGNEPGLADGDDVTCNVGTHYSRYLSELLSLGCGPALLSLNLYPDAKELTESFAAFRAVRQHLGAAFSPDDPSVTCVCVGDGSLPRTAALFAYRTKWQCCAVDPQMKEPGTTWRGVERLEARTKKIEDCHFAAEKLLLVCVHAHVGLAECLGASEWRGALGVVAIPCCNFYSRLQLQRAPLAEYKDLGIVSPHRLVRVYQVDGPGPGEPCDLAVALAEGGVRGAAGTPAA